LVLNQSSFALDFTWGGAGTENPLVRENVLKGQFTHSLHCHPGSAGLSSCRRLSS